MSRDAHISDLKPTDFTFLMNGTIVNESGNNFNIQNEPSNQFAVRFPQGFKSVGFKNDILKERTYYFLTNPTTRVSSIGYVSNKVIEAFNNDLEQECPECNERNVLGARLEDTVQTPVLEYYEYFNDSCLIESGKLGLNFDVNFPAKKIEIKQETLGTTLYWNDNRNPKRYLNVTNLDENPTSHYLITREIPCGDDEIVDCILIDKLLAHPKHKRLRLQPEIIQTGGNLKRGTYEFHAVYCDILGNEMTNYGTPTNPIPIFDENNVDLSQPTLDSFTNFAIKIKVNNLDTTFKYYKIVCVERTNVDNTTSAFVEGIHPTTDDTVMYTHSGSAVDDNITRGNVSIKRRIDQRVLNLVKPSYERAKGTMVSGGVMYDYGLQEKEVINLQPVVNLFSSLFEWQTLAAKESLYKGSIANSLYKGFMRNEVQPFSIRFINKDGSTTPSNVVVGRPANDGDLEIISDANYSSINTNAPTCGINTRNKKWQIFNTAIATDTCNDIVGGATIIETISKSCTLKNVAEIPSNSITLETGEVVYKNLEKYIKDNEGINIPGITSYLEDTYLGNCPIIFGSTCSSATLVSESNDMTYVLSQVTDIIIGDKYIIQTLASGDDFSNLGFTAEDKVFTATSKIPNSWINGTVVYATNEVLTYNDKNINDYVKATAPKIASMYQRDSATNRYKEDTAFEAGYMTCTDRDVLVYNLDGTTSIQGLYKKLPVYLRDSSFQNENCSLVTDIGDNLTSGDLHILNYMGGASVASLLSTRDADPLTVDSYFQNKIHKKAIFLKGFKNSRNSLILEITPNSDCPSDADSLPNLKMLRYTVFKSCSDNTILDAGIVNTDQGLFKILDTTLFPSTFIIAIDAPIISDTIDLVCGGTADTTVYKIAPPCGAFSIFTRDLEHVSVTITWDKILLDKIQVYQSDCQFSIPKVDDCEPKPYVRGTFSYWESSETYPDNKQLYDSSKLKIKPEYLDLLSESMVARFKEHHTEEGNTDISGKYILKPETNLTCQRIRHPKFPDNTVAPFMLSSESQQDFADTIIFPLGMSVDTEVIKTILRVAKENNYLTQEQFDNIEGWEILRGDNTVHKSVIANGLGFDLYNYTNENGDKWHYPNFPFNDLGDDKFHTSDANRDNLIRHPYQGLGNHLFSFLSPDLVHTKPALPTEITLSGFQMGNAVQNIVDVKDHPRYTILGDDAKSLAEDLAVAEFTLETLIKLTENTTQGATGNIWFMAGFANGTNGIGAAISAAALILLAASTVANGFMKIGQYRYEWLKIFRDLGATHNFSAMTVGNGSYNRFLKTEDNSSEYLRALSVRKYLGDNMYTTVDKADATKLNVNNWMREESVVFSVGSTHKFNYPSEYILRDNNTLDNNTSSKVLASDLGCATNRESTRNIGSPYFTMKNYIPDQWGTVDSIEWLTTNSTFSLSLVNEYTTILGGTVTISPYSVRRKTPLFRENAMGQPNKTSFNYSEYNNIGYTKHYLDYEIGSTYSAPLLKIPFPDIASNFKFDCVTGNDGFYLQPPSKLYLYSYGIVTFLVESEINCHFRYGGKEEEDKFYPQVSDVYSWVQEVNLPIAKPNKFFYSNTYSLPVSRTPNLFLDYTYDKEVWAKRNEKTNGIIYSEQDTNETSLVDPWLVYKPLNAYEFKTKFGKLIDLKDIESNQFLARFENQLVLHNSIDNLADKITPQNKGIGTGGVFAGRPLEFKSTELGFAGTQNTEICSTPYGHFYVDAKRGRVVHIDQNGKDLGIISEQSGNQPSNMKQWFREHLPFKILKDFPEADIDNKFKGLGLNMWYDDRNSRVFITKRDYVSKKNPCLKYDDKIGFYSECSENVISCPDGYTYNELTEHCELITTSADLCPAGYTYNQQLKTCTLIEVSEADCSCQAEVIVTEVRTTNANCQEIVTLTLSSNQPNTSFTWSATEVGQTGTESGAGTTITKTLTPTNTVPRIFNYVITPNNAECTNIPLNYVLEESPYTTINVHVNAIGVNQVILDSVGSNAGCTVNWGDGVVEQNPTDLLLTHNYNSTFTGEIIVTLYDTAQTFNCSQPFNGDPGHVELLASEVGKFRCLSNLITRGKLTGNIIDLPNINTLTAGETNLTGNLSQLPSRVKRLDLGFDASVTVGNYTQGRVWSEGMRLVRLNNASHFLTASEIDSILIDLANVVSWIGSSPAIEITGGGVNRTSASNAAVVSLNSKGVTVTIN
jgi:hypothetical protein